jgi:hypothetical protein
MPSSAYTASLKYSRYGGTPSLTDAVTGNFPFYAYRMFLADIMIIFGEHGQEAIPVVRVTFWLWQWGQLMSMVITILS